MQEKQIVILGNSPAAFQCVETLRQEGFSGDIVMLVSDGEYPYCRVCLPDVLSKDIPLGKMFCASAEDFEKRHKIRLVTQKISRINFKRRRVTTEDKQVIPFDYCLLDEYGWLYPENSKGTNKSGAYLLNRMDHMKAALKELLFAETVIVQSDSFSGLRAVYALAQEKREVIWICPGKYLLSSVLDREISGRIQAELERKGIRVIFENTVTELLGDNTVKAVRLSSGKVIAGQMVFFEAGQPDFRIFKETDLQIDGKIVTRERHVTAYGYVFAVGGVSQATDTNLASYACYDDVLRRQGQSVALDILQKSSGQQTFVPYADFKWPDFQLTVLGRTQPGCFDTVYEKSHADSRSLQKLYIRKGGAVGAVLVNSETFRENILSFIHLRKALSEEELSSLGFHLQTSPVQPFTEGDAPETAFCGAGQPSESV